MPLMKHENRPLDVNDFNNKLLQNQIIFDSSDKIHKDIKNNIRFIFKINKYPDEVSNTVISLYDFILDNNAVGFCIDASVILYVWLKDHGYNAEYKAGIHDGSEHFWITLDKKIIDISIVLQYIDQMSFHKPFMKYPVILGKYSNNGLSADKEYYSYTSLKDIDVKSDLVKEFIDFIEYNPEYNKISSYFKFSRMPELLNNKKYTRLDILNIISSDKKYNTEYLERKFGKEDMIQFLKKINKKNK